MVKKLLIATCVVYLLCCIALLCYYVPGHDTLYYVDWSEHLAVGYYDGPPVIAYYLRLFTAVLGHSEKAIVFIGLLSNAILGLLVYLLAKTLFDKQIGVYALIAWLATPLAFGIYGLQVTCDTPAAIFAILTLYYFFLFYKHHKGIYIYLAAVAAALMMLSKLTGATICLSLLVLLCAKPYRPLLKSIHLYLAALLFVVLVVPLMWWGAKYGVEGIQFQVHHGLSQWGVSHLKNMLNYVVSTIAMYNLYMFLFIYVGIRYFKVIKNNAELLLVFVPAVVVLLFYFVASLSSASFHWNWNDLFYIAAVIGIAYAATQTKGMRRFFVGATIFNLVVLLILIVLVICNITGLPKFEKMLANTAGKDVALELKPLLRDRSYVFSNDYKLSALLNYYVPREHAVYSLPGQGNQYQYWSKQANQQLQQQALKQFVFLKNNSVVPVFSGYACHHIYTTSHVYGVNLAVGGSNLHVYAFACHKRP